MKLLATWTWRRRMKDVSVWSSAKEWMMLQLDRRYLMHPGTWRRLMKER
jgi:hypothetical protein